jgi:hypothetical protein
MTRYLEVKPGSIAEVAIRLRDDYQAYFKKELEKSGKGIAQMSDAEKKAFFNRVDKAYNAKNEAKEENEKTTLVAKPGDKEEVKRIPVDKLADYKKQGWVEAESFVPEAATEPYAIGMAAAMKQTGDKPPLKKSTIVKAHDIAKKIEKQEQVKEEIKVDKPAILKSLQDRLKKLESDPDHGGKQDMIDYVKSKIKMLQSMKEESELQEITDEEEKNYGRQITSLSNDKVMARINKKGDAAIATIQAKIDSVKAERDKKRAQKNEEVEITEGQYKEIDIRKGDLKLAKDKKQALKDKYNAIMAGQASGDEQSIGDQIQKLDMSIKKQEQELIDIMKKSKETKKEEVESIEEAAGPNRLTNLNDKITRLQVNLQKLDKSKPESKTKEAILKSDLATAKLRLQDLMQKSASAAKKAVNEANKVKQSYKTLKMSLKKEQEVNNKKKTLTDKPITKIEVNPKIEG